MAHAKTYGTINTTIRRARLQPLSRSVDSADCQPCPALSQWPPVRQTVLEYRQRQNDRSVHPARPGDAATRADAPGLLRAAAAYRGDRDWGTEANMQAAEQAGVPYLFKQRLTKNTQRLIER